MTSHDHARFPVPQPDSVAVLEDLEANQVVLDNAEINNVAFPSASDHAHPARLALPDVSSEDDWSAEHSSLEDDDSMIPDTAATMEDSVGGNMKARHHTSAMAGGDTSPTKAEKGDQRKHSDSSMIHREISEPKSARKQSIQIILEKTDKKGRYRLTADDPELREILKAGLEREAQGRENEIAGKNGRKRFRDLVFTRRFTTFDRQNPQNAESHFYGFFTLFWIAMGLLLARIAAQNWKIYGSMLGNAEILHMMLDRDVILLGITDGVMCLTTVFGVLLQLLILKGYLSWNRSGWVIQNIWQTLYLASCVGWTYYRDWPWTHTIFIVLHCLVFVMKQHSYAFYNGYLSQVYRRRKILEQKLAQLESMEPIATPATQATPAQHSQSTVSGITATGVDIYATSLKKTMTEKKPSMDFSLHSQPPSLSRKNSLTERRRSVAAKASTNLNKEKSEISNIASAIDKGDPFENSQMEAFSRIIRSEIRSLNEELNGKSTSGANTYPKNLTLTNWADWTCLPTLVYELEYPRQEKINWWYVAEKTAATFGVIWVMVVISQAYIYPPVIETVRMKNAGLTLLERWREFPWVVSDILFPLLLEQLLSWYVIWECCLNVLAELTRFADRGFYGDWWNSVSWDQYARDWNRPVHNFLLRHVYHSSISAMRLDKGTATFVTFLLSACVHELLMLCLFKKVRGYLFAMQLAQLPLASLSRTRWMKGRNMLGNIVFWFGLFVGPSVIMALYLIV